MSSKKSGNLDALLSAIFSDDDRSVDEIREDLKPYGIDCSRLQSRVFDLLNATRREESLSWIERAKKRDAQFQTILHTVLKTNSSSTINIRTLGEAIYSGKLGQELQQRASAHFRNRKVSDLSENDLRTFFEDFKILEMLKSSKKGDE